MDNTAPAPERAAQQAPPVELPTGWVEVQEELASSSGLSLLLVEGRQPPSLAIANNNSICRAFQASPKHEHLCRPDCGEAFTRAQSAGEPVKYRCHAGLHCVTMPVNIGTEKPLAVIGGRCFLRVADYRALAERIRAGDLSDLLSADLFTNVIFGASQDLEELSDRVAESVAEFDGRVRESQTNRQTPLKTEASALTVRAVRESRESESNASDESELGDEDRQNARSGKLTHGGTLEEACRKALLALADDNGFQALALLLRKDESFFPTFVTGVFETSPPRIALKPKEIKLLLAATGGDSIAVPAGGRTSSKHEAAVELYTLTIGDEIKGALLVGDANLSEHQRRALSNFCRDISMPLEMLRLREELERRVRAATHQRGFTEAINSAQPEDAYTMILRHSAELLHAERGSLLLFDERAGELSVKAALGPRAEFTRESRIRLGEGVSGQVMREGRPALVRDVSHTPGHHPAPPERSYKTKSFISYPIIVGGRKVGVLNMTDKAGGGSYDEFDVGLLDMIAPQMALALDGVEWHSKANQFQLLSITDPLTGLVNRRYLEERLQEELDRSKRHSFDMSFIMLDIDDFKAYNDTHGHQAGDLALEMTAQCLKTALRSADVAARYGGEEFSILLPQTGLSEARVIAERIRRRIERTQFPHDKSHPLGSVTVSIGISSFGPDQDSPAEVIHAADRALYIAKSQGKNCIESIGPDKSASEGSEKGRLGAKKKS